jgi:hypothetical protein
VSVIRRLEESAGQDMTATARGNGRGSDRRTRISASARRAALRAR